MNFDQQNSQEFSNQNSYPSSNFGQQQGQSFLGGLIQTVADNALQYGEHYAQNAIDNWAQHI